MTGKAARSGEVGLNFINSSLISSIFLLKILRGSMPESPKVNGKA